MTVPTTFMIGTVAGGTGGMVSLNSLLSLDGSAVDPDYAFTDFSGNEDMEDGSRRGIGYSMCTMNWASLTDTQRYQLRQFCPSLSNVVLIGVPTNETDVNGVHIWHTYNAEMLWATKSEDRQLWSPTQGGRVMSLDLTFRALILVA